jgi:hypothetical protein
MKSEVTEGLLTIAQFAEDSGLGAKGVKKIIAKSNCGVSKISGITFLNKTEIEQAFKTEIKIRKFKNLFFMSRSPLFDPF